MLNFTLTITAAPELLAAMSNFTKAITSAKVVTVPQIDGDFTPAKAVPEQIAESINYHQPPSQPITYPVQNPSVQQMNLAQLPVLNQPPAVPTSNQGYTMEQLAVAATQLVDGGRRAELVNLLSSFGVQALTALPKEQYGVFATQLRALGAKL